MKKKKNLCIRMQYEDIESLEVIAKKNRRKPSDIAKIFIEDALSAYFSRNKNPLENEHYIIR